MDVTRQFDCFNVRPRNVCPWLLLGMAPTARTIDRSCAKPFAALGIAGPAHIESAALQSHVVGAPLESSAKGD